MKALGRHILVELFGCDKEILDSHELIKEHMVQAAKSAGATVVESVFHRFNPYGVSGVVVIAESHLAVHTWPEYGYAAVDVFTCGEEVDPWDCHKYLVRAFRAQRHESKELLRGELPISEKDLRHKPEMAEV